MRRRSQPVRRTWFKDEFMDEDFGCQFSSPFKSPGFRSPQTSFISHLLPGKSVPRYLHCLDPFIAQKAVHAAALSAPRENRKRWPSFSTRTWLRGIREAKSLAFTKGTRGS